MAYELKDNSGSAFKNRKKEKDSQPDLTGEAMIDGKIYWVSVWQKLDKNNNPWVSFSFKPKEFTKAKEAVQSSGFDDSGEIPF